MTPFQTLVCALDLSDDAPPALTWAADLAERTHAALHLVHADPLFRARLAHTGGADPDAAFHQRVRAAVGEALGAEAAFDVLGPEVHETHGLPPAEGVLQTAAAVRADLVVTGTRARRGLAYAMAGSVAADVLRRAWTPVLVVPDAADHPPPGPGRPVLAAVDFSETTAPTLEAAGQLAAAYGADVEVAHVLDATPEGALSGFLSLSDLPPSPEASARARARSALERLAAEAGCDGARMAVGEPRSGLLRLAAEAGAGALVVGTHGRTGWDRLRLGSVAEWAVRHAACAVLTVPAPRA